MCWSPVKEVDQNYLFLIYVPSKSYLLQPTLPSMEYCGPIFVASKSYQLEVSLSRFFVCQTVPFGTLALHRLIMTLISFITATKSQLLHHASIIYH